MKEQLDADAVVAESASPMPLQRMTGGQAVVRYLVHEGVSHILGIFGHGNVQLGEAIAQSRDKIKYILVKNEQSAVHIAAAYAKLTGRPLAVTTSVGPGATNMVTGAAAAKINRLPVILLPGEVFADGVGPVLQQLESVQDETVNSALKAGKQILVARDPRRAAPPEDERSLRCNAGARERRSRRPLPSHGRAGGVGRIRYLALSGAGRPGLSPDLRSAGENLTGGGSHPGGSSSGHHRRRRRAAERRPAAARALRRTDRGAGRVARRPALERFCTITPSTCIQPDPPGLRAAPPWCSRRIL